jgi:hypothetical protein
VPQLYGAFHNASNDPAQITAWWTEFPNANVAIAPGKSGLIVFDCDHGNVTEEDFRRWVRELGLPETLTVRTGRRVNAETGEAEFGTQMYYSAEGVTRNTSPWVEGTHGGEVRCDTGHVMAPGSIHPDSGERYEVLVDAPIAPCPDYVRNMRAYKLPVKSGPMEKIPAGGGRHAQLTSMAGKLRASGLDAEAIHAALIPINEAVCADPVGDEDLIHIAESVSRYAVHEPEPMVTVGKPAPEPDEFEDVESVARPVYPDSVWHGTPYGEFADYCAEDNFIPKRFFSEALRTVVGAVAGGQLSTDYQGVNARAYTVLIGPPGSGKGTAITAARQFVEGNFDSQTRTSERPLLWNDMHNSDNWCWLSRYIGAHVVSPASAPGLIQATKPHKLEKGESRNPMELWRYLPRFITIQEEIGGLFANFANENSGRGLETAILELYDRDSFTTTATNERSAKSGQLLYSILGGIPKKEWDDIFAGASSVGSGLFSRLNIIGTENERTVAGLPEYDFAEMQRRFLPRFSGLERTPARIPLSPNGRALLNEWFTRISAELKDKEVPSARLNIHALRVGLHLAWLHGHANILESDVDSGIKVADFQAKMREFYLPAEGESRDAQWEQRIMKIMRAKRSLTYRELQTMAHSARAGTTVWERAVSGLKRDGRIAVVDEPTKAGRTRKAVKLLKQRE